MLVAFIASAASFFPALWIVVLIHEVGHARSAERLTGESEVAVRIGAPVLGRLAPTVTARLGLRRTEIYCGPFPASGYCAHAAVPGRCELAHVYAAGTRSTLGAGIRSLPATAVIAGVAAIRGSGQRFVLVTAAAVLTFTLLCFVDVFFNRVLPIGPWFPGAGPGNDGYVLRKLRDPTYTPPDVLTAAELQKRFRRRGWPTRRRARRTL